MKRREFINRFASTVCVIGLGNSVSIAFGNDFKFPSGKDIKLRFAVASDGHFGQPETSFDQMHDEMMAWLNKEHQHRSLSFTMFNGDLIHDDPALLERVKKKYDLLKMPYYTSHGNHDRVEEAAWQKAWQNPFNYSFEMGDVGFIVLDTADIKGNLTCPDLEWTKNELMKFQKRKAVFIFMHVTPFKWTDNGINCRKLTRLFSRFNNVKAIFHGHDHDMDYVKMDKGKPYFFDSHIGGSWGTDYRGYRIVEVLNNGEILSYQVNPLVTEPVNQSAI